MRKIISILAISLLMISVSCNQPDADTSQEIDEGVSETTKQDDKSAGSSDIKPEYITAKEFKAKVWDYEANPEQWTYNGELPCVVDFYADWCKPCKMVAPIMDELADYYEGRVLIYKVNTDKERELASVFQVRSIPAILFSPMDGKPAMQAGAMSKEDYIKIIDEFILGIKNESDNNKKQS